MKLVDTAVHKWLRVPYALNIRYIRRVKRPRSTLLFIHGLGDTGDMWQSVIKDLPDDVTVIVVDLLGFGDSPRPAWSKYDVRAQARSLLSTYLSLRIRSRVIVIGHSLGALVAVDFARRYPVLTQSLILCSPPIYRPVQRRQLYTRPDDVLRSVFARATSAPDAVVKFYGLGKKIGVANKSLTVTNDNIDSFIMSLQASIIDQNTHQDINKLSIPIHVIHGILDPFVVRSNLKRLAKKHENVTLHEVPAGHIVRGPYSKKLLKILDTILQK